MFILNLVFFLKLCSLQFLFSFYFCAFELSLVVAVVYLCCITLLSSLGIEAEAVMLGQPITMVIPEVVGCRLVGELPSQTTSTDLVLTITKVCSFLHLFERIFFLNIKCIWNWLFLYFKHNFLDMLCRYMICFFSTYF